MWEDIAIIPVVSGDYEVRIIDRPDYIGLYGLFFNECLTASPSFIDGDVIGFITLVSNFQYKLLSIAIKNFFFHSMWTARHNVKRITAHTGGATL